MGTTALTLSIIELLLRVGPTAAITMMKSFEKSSEEITVDDIKALMVKLPNTYMEGFSGDKQP